MKCVFNSHFNSFLLSLIYFKVNKTTKIAKKKSAITENKDKINLRK